jgi:cyanophycinase
MKKIIRIPVFLVILSCFAYSSCQKVKKDNKLFIIGGGAISPAMIDKMILESKLNEGGYGVILPMSSEEPDSAIVEHKPGFVERGCSNIYSLQFKKGEAFSQAKIDSIRNAKLIFISGGDQSRFMDIIAGTSIAETIHQAVENGSLLCGTSAGASLMSKTMVTGNELKYPDGSGNFITMEASNVELINGLGMLEKVVIDQHFIKRKRLNRLVSICMENPGKVCVGIDEATAIFVHGNNAIVYGKNQVVVLRNKKATFTSQDGLLGSLGLQLDVFLPGESFKMVQ